MILGQATQSGPARAPERPSRSFSIMQLQFSDMTGYCSTHNARFNRQNACSCSCERSHVCGSSTSTTFQHDVEHDVQLVVDIECVAKTQASEQVLEAVSIKGDLQDGETSISTMCFLQRVGRKPNMGHSVCM